VLVFFFKQKTAYEVSACLVGSAPALWASWNASLASTACQYCAWTPATTSSNPAGCMRPSATRRCQLSTTASTPSTGWQSRWSSAKGTPYADPSTATAGRYALLPLGCKRRVRARSWASTRGTDGFSELAVVQGVVEAAALQQLCMVAMFHDASAVHDDDRVGVSDRGQPVGDDEAGAALS